MRAGSVRLFTTFRIDLGTSGLFAGQHSESSRLKVSDVRRSALRDDCSAPGSIRM